MYNFEWMGRPIIQLPHDILAMQEIIWEVKPDLIIETGIAHGGSLIMYASFLEMMGINNGAVLGIDYSKKDLKKAKKLCALDFHTMDVRPKMKSTSPGLEFFDGESGRKLAKYKLSTSCSYTPSILGYYHFSRILNIGQVPVAVLRNMDRQSHIKMAELGVEQTTDMSGWLPKNWATLLEQLKNGSSRLTTTDKTKSFGALVTNPRGEELYREMYGSGVNGYYKHALSKQAKKRGDLDKQFPRSFSNLPKLFALKDYVDMLVIDAILSQFDRYGNVNYWKYYYFIEEGKLKRKKYNLNKSFLLYHFIHYVQSDNQPHMLRRLQTRACNLTALRPKSEWHC